MARRLEKSAIDLLKSLPPLPLDADHWQAVCKAMRLSPRQATLVELILRDLGAKNISAVMCIDESTIKTYRQRIFARTGARTRMQLAMHVMAVSHQVNGKDGRRKNG